MHERVYADMWVRKGIGEGRERERGREADNTNGIARDLNLSLNTHAFLKDIGGWKSYYSFSS